MSDILTHFTHFIGAAVIGFFAGQAAIAIIRAKGWRDRAYLVVAPLMMAILLSASWMVFR